jgi:hypothetical protein
MERLQTVPIPGDLVQGRVRCACWGRTEAGLTLVEVVFALAILMFGLLALTAPIHYATSSLANSKAIALATELAASRMEAVKADPIAFFARLPEAQRPQAPLAPNDCDEPGCLPNLWHHPALDQDFGEIPGHPEFACYVLLESNLSPNTAVIRIPVVWLRPGGRVSTSTGQRFDPMRPDAPAAVVELISVIQYR